MTIRVIYKDKNIGIVNESRIEDLIRSGRIAAYCRPDEEWVNISHSPETDRTKAADTLREQGALDGGADASGQVCR